MQIYLSENLDILNYFIIDALIVIEISISIFKMITKIECECLSYKVKVNGNPLYSQQNICTLYSLMKFGQLKRASNVTEKRTSCNYCTLMITYMNSIVGSF